MVITDTSVWIAFIRNRSSEHGMELSRLLHADEVAITGPVLAEVLQGARNPHEFARFSSDMEAVRYLDVSREAWVWVAETSQRLRRAGQAVALTDLSIAAVALLNDSELYTLDRDFGRVPGLRLHQLPPT